MLATGVWQKDKFVWLENINFKVVAEKCGISAEGMTRAVGIWYDGNIVMYLLTAHHNNVSSFHGYNFTKGAQWFLLPFARRYIKEEKLEWSSYNTPETKAILKRLGFKEVTTVMRKI